MKQIQKRIQKLESQLNSKDLYKLTRYDILVNGQSILPSPLRTYQREFFDQFVHEGPNRAYLCWPRRSGKSFTAFIALVYICLRDDNTNAFQLFPDFQMANKIIWNGVFIKTAECGLNESMRFVDMLPRSLCSLNHSTMTMRFSNGSSLRLMGSDNPDKIRGITSDLIAVSEYAFCKEYVLRVLSPIISSSKGRLLLESTPNGQNFAYRQLESFKTQEEWHVSHESIYTLLNEDGERYITQHVVQLALGEGMPETLIKQEFECLPVLDEQLIVYGAELKEIKVLECCYQPRLDVHFAFDLGISDNTSIVGFQIRPDGGINIVWCYENNNKPYEFYINEINKVFGNRRMGTFVLPHDAQKRSGMTVNLATVADHFESFGCRVEVLKRPSSMGGFIALVKSHMAALIVDKSCEALLDSLNNYTYCERTRKPLHDRNSHYASAFGYAIMWVYHNYGYDTAANGIRENHFIPYEPNFDAQPSYEPF